MIIVNYSITFGLHIYIWVHLFYTCDAIFYILETSSYTLVSLYLIFSGTYIRYFWECICIIHWGTILLILGVGVALWFVPFPVPTCGVGNSSVWGMFMVTVFHYTWRWNLWRIVKVRAPLIECAEDP